MKINRKVDWDVDLVNAAKQQRLAYFVGNGLSRLSGVPSWGDLFRSEEVSRALRELRVDRRTVGNIELADLLEARSEGTWTGVLNVLHAAALDVSPNLVHRIMAELLKPKAGTGYSVVTSNVDDLIETSHIAKHRNILYLHGQPDDMNTWMFSTRSYWKGFEKNDGKDQPLRSLNEDCCLLFLGYGHSSEDFDISRSMVKYLQTRGRGASAFSLLSSGDRKRGELVHRLESLRVRRVDYELPPVASSEERLACLSDALLQLADQARGQPWQGDTWNASYAARRAECDVLLDRAARRRSVASVVLGLAGENKHLVLAQGIPSGGRRFSLKAKVHVEPGGPAYIVSSILASAGLDSYLVSKIGDDAPGQRVIAGIQGFGAATTEGRIFTDFLEQTEPDPLHELEGFQTWQSYILEPSDENAHRVFVDRQVETSRMALPSDRTHALAGMLREDSRRVVYFDKYFRGGVQAIIKNADFKPLSDSVWTVYETGSEGDRYSDTSPKDFDRTKAYQFETSLRAPDDSSGWVNVVTASFRFARDYLGHRRGALPDAEYDALVHRHDSDEILQGRPIAHSEDEAIHSLVNDSRRLESFVAAVRRGADRFLRTHPLRAVVVTLHGEGCIVIPVPLDSKEATRFALVPSTPVGGRLYTASAGDVFRAALVSALAHAAANGVDAAQLATLGFWQSVGQLSNDCAGLKVAAPTVQGALPAIAGRIGRWRQEFDAARRQGDGAQT